MYILSLCSFIFSPLTNRPNAIFRMSRRKVDGWSFQHKHASHWTTAIGTGGVVRLGRGQVWGRCACGGMRQAYEEVFDGESVFGVVCCGVAMICCLLPFEVHVPCVCASACVLCVSVRTSASLILKITPPRTHGDLIFSSLSNVHVLNESTKRRPKTATF